MAYHNKGKVLFGAAYYHEYHQSHRLEEDLDLMVKALFSVIRVGESVWSTWEPENGRFDLEWIAPILDGAHERGLKVILGTPTYAAPMWLARLYPEINVELTTGSRMGWGQRQEIDYSHPAFLFHAERLVRRILERHAGHPAIIGFQVDNEPGFHVIHNEQVFQRFVDHLRHKYGTVEAINREWGLTYWSHNLSTWADLWRPDANLQPQYDLAWRRFQAELTTGFVSWQSDVVREYANQDQFITCDLSYDRQTVDDEQLLRGLDIGGANLYYRMQDGLALPGAEPMEQGWTTTGVPALYWSADRAFASRQAPFLVMETNAQAISHQWQNEPAYDGQWRQAAWALISRGASMIEYWHWHTNVYGTETYWGGVLPHSLRPGRVYRQLARLGEEISRAGRTIVDLEPDHDVLFLYSHDSKWSLAENPQIGGYRGADPRGYHRILEGFHDGAFHAGLQSRIVHPAQLTASDPYSVARRSPVLVVAGYVVSDDNTLAWLRTYVAAGGHLLLGPRSGYEDVEGRARTQTQPACFADLAGAWYDEFSTLDAEVPVCAEGQLGAEGDLLGGARLWVDALNPEGCEVLAGYAHPHFGRWAAATTKEAGEGRVTLVGTVPDRGFGQSLFEWVRKVSLPEPKWGAQHAQQSVTGAQNPAGERVRFVHNWGWEPTTFALPGSAFDVLSEELLEAGSILELRPWDVRILRIG